ncbi:hypothetical protein BH11PSE3_BH11PSE3_01050 [soil metagenome]
MSPVEKIRHRAVARGTVPGVALPGHAVAEFAAFRDTPIAFFAEMVKSADIRIE